MKKTIKFMLAAIAILSAASCQDELVPQEGVSGEDKAPVTGELVPMTLSASVESITKTYIDVTDGVKPYWEAEDVLAVFDGVAKNEFTIREGSRNGASAMFDGSAASGTTVFWAAYPHDAAVECVDGIVTATLPATQTLSDNNVASGALLAVAKGGADAGLGFKNVCAIVKVKVEVEGMNEIFLVGKNDEVLAGTVKVNAETGDVTEVVDGSKTVVLKAAEGETFATGEYFISILPVSFTKGFDVIITRSEDSLRSIKETSNTLSLGRNQGKNLGAVTSGFAVEWGNVIMDKEDMKTFHADLVTSTSVKTWYLGADVDMNGLPWETPISGGNATKFLGTFDGRGHRIYNLVNETAGQSRNYNSGLFNEVENAVIKNFVLGSKDGKTYDGLSRIVNHTVYAGGFDYVGGVVARLQGTSVMTNVVNFAPVTVSADNKSSARVGGLVGHLKGAASLSYCTNYGKVSSLGTPSALYQTSVGGLVACQESTAAVTMQYCYNRGDVYSEDSGSFCVGGLVGVAYQAVTMTECANYNEVKCVGNNTGADAYVAGCVAYTNAVLKLTNVDNEGDVYTTTPRVRFFGGIAGHCQTTAVLTDCDNNGDVTYDSGATDNLLTMGGVIGMVNEQAASKISNCTNSGTVLSRKNNSNRIGGIVGTIKLGSIESCINSGDVKVTSSGTNQFAGVGGILGFHDGEAEATVAKCTNTADAEIAGNANISGNMGVGGVVGISRATRVTDNENYGDVISACLATSGPSYAGGIIGWCFTNAAKAISGNENNGAVSASGNGKVCAGGVIGYNPVSSLTECSNFGAVSGTGPYVGAIVGWHESSGALTSCQVQGSVNGANISYDNYGLYICGTATGPVSDCYYEK